MPISVLNKPLKNNVCQMFFKGLFEAEMGIFCAICIYIRFMSKLTENQ